MSCRLQVGKPVRQVSGKGFRIQMGSRCGYSGFIQSLALAGTSEVFTHSEMPNPLLQASVIQTPELLSIDVIWLLSTGTQCAEGCTQVPEQKLSCLKTSAHQCTWFFSRAQSPALQPVSSCTKGPREWLLLSWRRGDWMLGTTWLWSIPQVNAPPRPSPGLCKWSSATPYSCDASATMSPLGGAFVPRGLGSVFCCQSGRCSGLSCVSSSRAGFSPFQAHLRTRGGVKGSHCAGYSEQS